jgi:hypothetical protein
MRLPILLTAAAGLAFAHVTPNDVTLQMILKPQGQRMLVLVRAPLAAMQDVILPEQPGGFLDLEHLDAVIDYSAKVWISDAIDLYEDGAELAKPRLLSARASLQSDRSFVSYDSALAHVTGPALTNAVKLTWDQTMLDLLFEYRIQSPASRFSFRGDPLWRLGKKVVLALRYQKSDDSIRAFEFREEPGLVRLDPAWHEAAARFVQGGFEHILSGTDHLLFLLCLVIPFRRLRTLIPIVTSFTAAHSITLIASAYNWVPDALWFPPLIEVLIALSIVFMAFENIAGKISLNRRWIIAFAFGLVHGFGFSFGLRETLQFAGSHLLTSLVSFNVGVELGQLFVLLLIVPLLELAFRFWVAERMGTIFLSAIVADTAWHWLRDRWDVLVKFPLPKFTLDLPSLLVALGWLIPLLALAGLAWSAYRILRERRAGRRAGVEPTP